PRMVPVFARSFPRAYVLSQKKPGERTTAPAEMDTQISVASLGQYLRPSFESFPRHSGYLKADPVRTAALRARYQAVAPGNLIVGLSWRSASGRAGEQKTADPSLWTDVLNVPGVTFINLQYGNCAADLAKIKERLGVTVINDLEIDSLKNMD